VATNVAVLYLNDDRLFESFVWLSFSLLDTQGNGLID